MGTLLKKHKNKVCTVKFNFTSNYARNLILSEFAEFSKQLPRKKILRIAIVGGNENEPEVKLLECLDFRMQVKVFGIENGFFLDLNDSKFEYKSEFDLVLCSQVLEHTWNHSSVLDNLIHLSRPGGFIWIGCPASNFPHGSPHYFTAGLTADYIRNLVISKNVNFLSGGNLGSKRLYRSVHVLRSWPTVRSYFFPIFFLFEERQHHKIKEILLRLKHFPDLILLQLTSRKVIGDAAFATETWTLLKKPNSSLRYNNSSFNFSK